MTQKQIYKIKFLQAFHPNIPSEDLHKYFCHNCGNFACWTKGGFYSKFAPDRSDVDRSLIIRFNQLDGNGMGEIWEI